MRMIFLNLCIIFSLFFYSCNCYAIEYLLSYPNNPYIPPKFKTKYTIEEHTQKITEITADIFVADMYNDIVKDFSVDIVYSIGRNNPEYFVIEVEYNKYFPYSLNDEYSHTTSYKHIMGFIEEDTYYVLHSFYKPGYDFAKDCFVLGQSPYSLSEYSKSKKYFDYYNEIYSGVYGVQLNDDILQIASTRCLRHNGCFDIHRPELAKYSPKIECMPLSFGIIPKDDYANYRRTTEHPGKLLYEDIS